VGTFKPTRIYKSNGYLRIRVNRFFSIPPVNIVRVRPRSTICVSLFQLRHSKRSHPHFSAGGCVFSLYSRYMSFSSCPFCISSPLPLQTILLLLRYFLLFASATRIYNLQSFRMVLPLSLNPTATYRLHSTPFPLVLIILQFPSIPPKG
jgi:hypothetical protein